MSKPEKISHEDHDVDAWVCLCGNTPPSDGFATCNEEGEDMEPTLGGGWTSLFVCNRCGRIVDQRTLSVVGRRPI
jgi:hypothetical protein